MTYFAFHPEAQNEFKLAVDIYEQHEYSLGHQFAVEVFRAVDRVLIYPDAWPYINNSIRSCLVRRFPYGIIYYNNKQKKELIVLAVMHLHRDPKYWVDRV